MRGEIGRAELFGEIAGERLHLVAPAEKSELFRVGGADFRQPFREYVISAFPRYLLEIRLATLRPCTTQKRAENAGRAFLFHDPGGTFGANHALVRGMVGIALDIAYLAIFERDLYPAPARAHVTGGVFDLLPGARFFCRFH
jgi:hypothetical protein